VLEVGQEWVLHISPFRLKETTTPTNAQVPANVVAFYAKDNGSGVSTLCYKNDAGTEVCMPTSGSFVTGTGVANRLAYWTGTSTLDDVPRTFTAGSVLFAHSDFLPQEDNTNFFWDDSNDRLGIKTNAPAMELHVIGTIRSDFASGQAYDIARRAGDLRLLSIQSQTSGAPHNIELYTKDGDGTDAMSINMFAKGTPASVTNRELLQFTYDTGGPHFALVSNADGTGTVRPLKLYTGANTSQLILNIDGTTSTAGAASLATGGGNIIIGGGATASRLRLLEASGSGTNYTEFVVQPQAGNITYTLPADDGDPGEVLSTDGSGVLDWIASAASFNYGLHIAVPQIAYRL